MSPIVMRGQTVRYHRGPGGGGSSDSGGRTGLSADAGIRASDAERAAVAEDLSRHFADGRLDQPEFKVRLDRAMGATTRGDLGGLFDDLPSLTPDEPAVPARRRRLGPAAVLVLVVALVVAVSIHSTVSVLHVPWLLLVVAGLLLWRRARWHRTRRAPSELDR